MTTPPVPQWAVDAAKEHYANIFRCFEADPDAPEQIETVMALARIIAAHAPRSSEDGARLDWLEKQPVLLCAEGDGKWSSGHAHNFTPYAVNAPSIRAAIDAARKKDL